MMTGSIIGTEQVGLIGGFKPEVLIGIGDPDNVIFAPSGTFLVDHVNGTMYINDSAGLGAGSEWQLIGSTA